MALTQEEEERVSALATEAAEAVYEQRHLDMLDRISTAIGAGFDQINKRLDTADTKMDERFDAADTKMDERFDAADTKMDERFNTVDAELGEIRGELDSDTLDGDEPHAGLRQQLLALNNKIDGRGL